MFAILRRVLVLVTIVAFAGGMTVQATPSAAALGLSGRSAADTGCPHMATHHSEKQRPMPIRGTDADCIKQMGCIGTASLPIRQGEPAIPVSYTRITYSLPSTPRVGGSVEPELVPPIGR
jgi:hypothetical protein